MPHNGMPSSATEPDRLFPAIGAEQPHVVDSSARIWSIYLTHAEKFDKALVESWKGDMDGILIFSGLFSAVVSTFLVASDVDLQKQTPDPSAILLSQVTALLAQLSNTTQPTVPPLVQKNSITAPLWINCLWFLSLFCSLSCALAATLVQQWSRTYLQGTDARSAPHERARMRTYLRTGVDTFRVQSLVAGIPLLLHIAVGLFTAGLLVFLFTVNSILARVVLAFVVPSFVVYAILTILPVFFFSSPYKTPLSSILWHALQFVQYSIETFRYGWRYARPLEQSDLMAAEWSEDNGRAGTVLDSKALQWTMCTLTDDDDLEPFIAAIPGLLQTERVQESIYTIQSLLFGPDMLAQHIARLLRSCTSSETFTTTQRKRLDSRAVTCLKIVSLLAKTSSVSQMASPELWPLFGVQYFNPVVRDVLALRTHDDPAIADLAQHTAILLTWRAVCNYRVFLKELERCALQYQAYQDGSVLLGSRNHELLRLQNALKAFTAGVYLQTPLKDLLSAFDALYGGHLAPVTDALLDDEMHSQLHALTVASLRQNDIGGALVDLLAAARAQLVQVKECLCFFFLHTSCHLLQEPGAAHDAAVADTLAALSTHLGWEEQTLYDSHAEVMQMLQIIAGQTNLDLEEICARYLHVHQQNTLTSARLRRRLGTTDTTL